MDVLILASFIFHAISYIFLGVYVATPHEEKILDSENDP